MISEDAGIDGVLDASALLALVLNEPGADIVENALSQRVVIGAVNFAEVLRELKRRGTPAPAGLFTQLSIIPFDEKLARMLADLESSDSRKLGLSFGDLACLALGMQLKAPVLTGDRNWLQAQFGVKIKLIR